MSPRSGRTWLLFGASALLVGLALFYVTMEALDLERREASAMSEAQLHESMRLALWRMDSALAPVLAQEAARAPSAPGWPPLPPHFEPFRLYFSVEETGAATSPELAPFLPSLRPPRTESEPAREQDKAVPMDDAQEEVRAAQAEPWQAAQTLDAGVRDASSPQVEQSKGEYQSRMKMAQQAAQNMMLENRKVPDPPLPPSGRPQVMVATPEGRFHTTVLQLGDISGWSVSDSEVGPLESRWIDGPEGRPELFLVRKLTRRSSGSGSIQGIWCDWARLERWLLAHTQDLFLESRLVPAPHPTERDQAALLATIPARFAPGAVARPLESARSPTKLILAAAWMAALGAIVAVGCVLRAAMSLGERRGRFVSAVTHELRTPLTTFRMYSQMLSDGMVPPASRGEYLATLKEESERLTRVVESVLLYSRLEEGRGGAHRERIAARALLDRVAPVLRKRAAEGGMTLAIESAIPADAQLDVDAQAVEQILLNLVDNACKYAQPGDPRLVLSSRTTGRNLEATCRDHGPGIPADEREAVFLPFRRGERHAAGTTPGVGLGLALARGLARALGGDLVLSPDGEGARFVLTLPLSSR